MHVRSRSSAEQLIRAERREHALHRVLGAGLVIELVVVVGIFAGLILSAEAPPVAPSFLGAENERGDPTVRAGPSARDEGDVGAAGGERSHRRERKPAPTQAEQPEAPPPAQPAPSPAAPEPSQTTLAAQEPAAAPTPAPAPPPPAPAAAPAPEPAAEASSGGSAGSSCEFTFEC